MESAPDLLGLHREHAQTRKEIEDIGQSVAQEHHILARQHLPHAPPAGGAGHLTEQGVGLGVEGRDVVGEVPREGRGQVVRKAPDNVAEGLEVDGFFGVEPGVQRRLQGLVQLEKAPHGKRAVGQGTGDLGHELLEGKEDAVLVPEDGAEGLSENRIRPDQIEQPGSA